MAVTWDNMPFRDSTGYTFFDIDGTYTFEDTGHQMFLEAGKSSQEFEETMRRRHSPGRNEPEEGRGNELALTLDLMEPGEIEEMEEAARNIEVNYRSGIDAAIKGLSGRDLPTVAHSAGWQEPIRAVTNGYFDDKIAAELDPEEGPRLNGRYQKPARMQSYIIQHGVNDPVEDSGIHANFIGDSNTDSEAIRYADATGGLGIAIGDSLGDAMEVEDATVYIGDETGEHHLAAALLHYHNTGSREQTAEFIDEYALDVSRGEAEPGELAYRNERHEYVQELVQEVRELG